MIFRDTFNHTWRMEWVIRAARCAVCRRDAGAPRRWRVISPPFTPFTPSSAKAATTLTNRTLSPFYLFHPTLGKGGKGCAVG